MYRFLLKLSRRRRLHKDLEAELAFHRHMAESAGRPGALGNTAAVREASLDLWRFSTLENLWRDARLGARSLVRNPMLTVAALASLGLGIGANTTLFSLAVEFLLSEPSVSDADSLVWVRIGGNSHTLPHNIEFARRTGLFAEVAGVHTDSYANWNQGSETKRVFAVRTTLNAVTVLGIPVALGRGYDERDPNEVVVLQHRFWQRHFHSDPNIVGRSMNLQGRSYTIVGVLPESHRTVEIFAHAPDLYMPIPSGGDVTHVKFHARLRPGMGYSEALHAAKVIGARLDAEHPEPNFKYAEHVRINPISGFDRLRRDNEARTFGAFFLALLALAGLVLLIACANIASLLLARTAARTREMAIRISIGASRARLLQQLLVESLLLALIGTAAGLWLAGVLGRLLAQIEVPLPWPIHLNIEPDWRVALYAAFLTIVTTVACGLLPALASVKQSFATGLQRASRRQRLRSVLVASQVAFSIIVLPVAFLFVRNLVQASAISPGFDLRNTIRAGVHLPARYANAAAVNRFANRSLDALKSIPGIEASAAARIIPFTDASRYGNPITLTGASEPVRGCFYWNAVSPEFFRAMDIPVLEGRVFNSTDTGQPAVVAVNRAWIRHYLPPSRQAVGATFTWGNNEIVYQIVGIVGATRNLTIGEEASRSCMSR